MVTAFELLFLAFSLLGPTRATPPSSMKWMQFQRSAVIKIDTPGYPLWLLDKANAPMLHEQAGDYYWPQDKPSAVLLNLTMSHDNKTLLLNHEPILPLANHDMPPLIQAYQAPANITASNIQNFASMGLLNREWEGLTLGWRFLALDYDRLVWADPASGPYRNHVPTLRFRIMGIGAHRRDDVLDPSKQKVLHVTLSDSNHGSSDSPHRSYSITHIELKDMEDSYAYAPALEPGRKECTLRSWRCPDAGLYREGAPWYRYIWRERFDEFGRIGSLRHAVYWKMDVLRRFWQDAGSAMVLSFIIVMAAVMFFMGFVGVARFYLRSREKRIRGLAEDDRLLGEEDEEIYVDEEVGDEKDVPPLFRRDQVQQGRTKY